MSEQLSWTPGGWSPAIPGSVAETKLGRYRTYFAADGKWRWAATGQRRRLTGYRSEYGAKAAAEAHYRQRLEQMLEPVAAEATEKGKK